MRYVLWVLGSWLFCTVQAQQVNPYSNLRKQLLPINKDTIILDSFRIVPSSLCISDLDSSWYAVDLVNNQFIWKKKPNTPVEITYRVFPFRFQYTYQRMKFDSVMFKVGGKPYSLPKRDQKESGFDFGNLNYTGSFGRSLSFGNRQDVVVNSSLNLQLNGYIGDSILLAAALSDNNIPIQPDGNTQDLNEFDQVFIQFSKKNWKFNMGDIDIRQQKSYFLNFYKRLQGAVFENETKIGQAKSNKLLVSGAIAKGKFSRQQLQAIEGNQGPYRLKGSNNELFFIVLAGSERIWIDGELMQRGEDQDYVINYNTAEITFTPKQMITKDKRIQVEFEYADRNYLNAQVYMHDDLKLNDKWKVKFSAFSNADAKNAPINQTLNASQRNFLANLGDSVRYAYYPSSMLDTFSTGKILYRKIDTTINGIRDSIFVYSTDKLSKLYQLNFIDVGYGNGNYIQDFSAAVNGKLYKWSPPINGKKTGNFEPAVLIVAPRTQQMIAVGTDFHDRHLQLSSEIAISRLDLNTFSNHNKDNDDGMAFRLNGVYDKPLHNKERSITTDWQFERISKTFRPLERFRTVEFYRDWGLPLDIGTDGESLMSAGIALKGKEENLLKYSFGGYHRDSGYNGIKHGFLQQAKYAGWNFNNAISFTKFNTAFHSGFFFRPFVDISKQLKHILPRYNLGVQYSLEQNESRYSKTDSMDARSFAFDIFKLYLKSPEDENKWGLNVFTRGDKLPTAKGLVRTDRSLNYNGFVELLKSEHHSFRLNATYRKLAVYNKDLSPAKAEATILGRTEYLLNAWRGAISGNVLYELGSGQEPRREFAYLEVPAGQGEYTWIDYNADGLQQLNEFEIARFRDQARFIRIFTPTLDFIRSSYLQFNYSFIVNPKQAFGKKQQTGLKQLFSKLYWQTSLQSGRKNTTDGLVNVNPFQQTFGDTSLLTLDKIFSNTISFNRFAPNWGFDLNNIRSEGKAFLSYGYEARAINDWSLKGRWTIKKKYTAEWIVKRLNNRLQTPGLANRNFDIKGYSVEPKFTYTKETMFRFKAGLKWDKRNNIKNEEATIRSINTEIKYNVLSKTSLTGLFTYSKINYTGVANTTIAYTMLEGLVAGKNYLWTIDLTRRLTKFLELSFQYEGRKAGESGIVHIGRGQVRALF